MSKYTVSESINDINNEFYKDVVLLGNSAELDQVATKLNSCLTKMEELESLLKRSRDLSVKWEGEAELVYADLLTFKERFLADMEPAIKSYKEMAEKISIKHADIQNANALKGVNSIKTNV